jgi:hypothetical protein
VLSSLPPGTALVLLSFVQSFLDEMASTGEPLGRSLDELENRINSCLPGALNEALLTAVEVCDGFRALFRQFAAPFDVNYKSEVIIKAQLDELVRRVPTGVQGTLESPGRGRQRVPAPFDIDYIASRKTDSSPKATVRWGKLTFRLLAGPRALTHACTPHAYRGWCCG